MAKVIFTLSARNRSLHKGELRLDSLTYSSTIPLDIPLGYAFEIIAQFVSDTLLHEEHNVANNKNRKYGTLRSITEDIARNCYSFSIEDPYDEGELEYEYEIPEEM